MRVRTLVVVTFLCAGSMFLASCKMWPFSGNKESEAPQVTTAPPEKASGEPGFVKVQRGDYEKLMLTAELLAKELEVARLQQAQGGGQATRLAVTPEDKDMVIADLQRVDAQLSDLRRQRDELDKRIRSLQTQRAQFVARLGGESAYGEGIFGIESKREPDATDPALEKRIEEIKRKLPEGE